MARTPGSLGPGGFLRWDHGRGRGRGRVGNPGRRHVPVGLPVGVRRISGISTNPQVLGDVGVLWGKPRGLSNVSSQAGGQPVKWTSRRRTGQARGSGLKGDEFRNRKTPQPRGAPAGGESVGRQRGRKPPEVQEMGFEAQRSVSVTHTAIVWPHGQRAPSGAGRCLRPLRRNVPGLTPRPREPLWGGNPAVPYIGGELCKTGTCLRAAVQGRLHLARWSASVPRGRTQGRSSRAGHFQGVREQTCRSDVLST